MSSPPDAEGGVEVLPEDPPVHHWALLAGTAVTVLVIDQLTKWWAVEELSDRTIDLVWTLRLNLVENRGAAFSFGGGGGWGPLISLLAIVVVAFLLFQARSMASRWGAVALGLVLGGALGNLTDRALRGDGFLHGAVIDFIDAQWWPVFNVADIGVVVGGLLLVVLGVFGPDARGDGAASADGGAS